LLPGKDASAPSGITLSFLALPFFRSISWHNGTSSLWSGAIHRLRKNNRNLRLCE